MSRVPLADRKVVHAIGYDVGVEQRPVAGEILVLSRLPRGADLIHDLLQGNRVPDDRRMGEQAQSTGLVHDLLHVGISEFAAVGEEQPLG